jgi:hypothetical protein
MYRHSGGLCLLTVLLSAHHLAGVWWLLWAQCALQLTLLCNIVELFVPAALAGIWRACSGVLHALSILAHAILARVVVLFVNDLAALPSCCVAPVLCRQSYASRQAT